jgi:hypothetical protein
MNAKIIGRGYVLEFHGGKTSAVVQRAQVERMQRRFGGIIVDVKGRAYRVVNGCRVLA